MNNDALRQLYERYSREIYLYLLSLCRDGALAEDLMQETFLKALLSLDETHANLRAWLYTVARNLFFDGARRQKLELSLTESMLPEASQDPDELLETKLRNERLREAVMKLDPRKREVIVLQYFSGLSVKEIASVMRISEENVRVLAYRAKKELKESLEDKHEIQ